MKLSDKAILAIQVSGFIGALAVLPFMHGWAQALFSTGFAVHFIGDLFRLDKDGVINVMGFFKKLFAKAQEYVKLVPWLQYVGLQVAQMPTGHKWASITAGLSSLAFFLLNRKKLGPNDPMRRELLASAGYPLMLIGMLSGHALVQFVGFALAMTEFVYELIYP